MNNKTCSKCKRFKPLTEFFLVYPAKNDGKLRPDCKDCVRKRQVEHINNPTKYKKRIKLVREVAIKKAKEFVRNYLLTHPCVDCGETDTDVLDFDHVRGEKLRNVSQMVCRGYRLRRIKDEIEKCEVRCANDHRRITVKRRREAMRA